MIYTKKEEGVRKSNSVLIDADDGGTHPSVGRGF